MKNMEIKSFWHRPGQGRGGFNSQKSGKKKGEKNHHAQ